eukprot:FR740873.1.p1 GENE.FR740873.1~~FR740873.1.p1  ORF type:complete len:246 (+),score=24.96 FR740873.1:1-738(+)
MNTYLKVGVPRDIIEPLFPLIFDELYHEVFGGTEGWSLNIDTLMVLDKLKEWQDTGDGPRLGVISNFDERLPKLLHALGISHYFDIIITSKECGMEKPCRQIFDIAPTRLGLYDRTAAIHVGDSFSKDIVGATAAGWNAFYVKSPAYSDLPPQTTETPSLWWATSGKFWMLLAWRILNRSSSRQHTGFHERIPERNHGGNFQFAQVVLSWLTRRHCPWAMAHEGRFSIRPTAKFPHSASIPLFDC